MCDYCGKPGAVLKCSQCRQRLYCDEKCQKKHWRAPAARSHKKECKTLAEDSRSTTDTNRTTTASAEVHAPVEDGGGAALPAPPPTPPAEAEAADYDAGGSAATATATVNTTGTGNSAGDSDEYEDLCPICLDNASGATVKGVCPGTCFACGQSYCGACNSGPQKLSGKCPTCPVCRASFLVSDKVDFMRCHSLVHARSQGVHTPGALFNLGTMYATGHGTPQNITEALKCLTLAADQGSREAQFNLAIRYDQGSGVEKDARAAFRLWVQAAEQGHERAMHNVATGYRTGDGVAQDRTKAFEWYTKAAKSKHASGNALRDLAQIYFDGECGAKKDVPEALRLFTLAAEQGDASSAFQLGTIYGRGLHSLGKPDHVLAMKWMQLCTVQVSEGKTPEGHPANVAIKMVDQIVHATGLRPHAGTRVTTVLNWASMNEPLPTARWMRAKSKEQWPEWSKYINRQGVTVESAEGSEVKPGHVAVLLEGEPTPITFMLGRLKIIQPALAHAD